ncbi:MAG: transketolase family protein [Candidatus Vogelbacteria bacterium]|nr:transketolase family protein [Candidatus Vogelbacteria bacterium]
MLNPTQKLNPKLYDLNIEQVPIRKGFGEGLVLAAEKDERVVGLCADLTESTQMHLFRQKFPNRFIEIGVAEQNLAAVASGLAAMGKIPFLTSYAMFSPGRNWEQIRTTICYNDRDVKIIGSHAGVSVGPDGGTHQAIEDIAITRVIPRMTVVVPADAIEAKKATVALASRRGPTYLRLAREKTPVVTTEESPFAIGQANVLIDPVAPDALIIACGPLVYNALAAAKKLWNEKIEVTVINNHTIKPLDREAILKQAQRAQAVVTVEEHQQAGGLGGAIAELLAAELPTPIEFIGVADQFGQSGTPAELVEHYGMGITAIVEAVKKVIKRK